MWPRLELFEQLEHAGEQFAFTAWQFERQKMHVAVEERAYVFVGCGNFMLVQDADDYARIGHAGDFDIVQIICDPEAFLESGFERLNTRASRMNQRAVDVEKQKALLS